MPKLLSTNANKQIILIATYTNNHPYTALLTALARHDTNVLRAARFLSLFLILTGVGWLFLLPLDEYSRHTYVSENALLPGQVHTYFGGSEHNVFRAYRHEVNALAGKPPTE